MGTELLIILLNKNRSFNYLMQTSKLVPDRKDIKFYLFGSLAYSIFSFRIVIMLLPVYLFYSFLLYRIKLGDLIWDNGLPNYWTVFKKLSYIYNSLLEIPFLIFGNLTVKWQVRGFILVKLFFEGFTSILELLTLRLSNPLSDDTWLMFVLQAIRCPDHCATSPLRHLTTSNRKYTIVIVYLNHPRLVLIALLPLTKIYSI